MILRVHVKVICQAKWMVSEAFCWLIVKARVSLALIVKASQDISHYACIIPPDGYEGQAWHDKPLYNMPLLLLKVASTLSPKPCLL